MPLGGAPGDLTNFDTSQAFIPGSACVFYNPTNTYRLIIYIRLSGLFLTGDSSSDHICTVPAHISPTHASNSNKRSRTCTHTRARTHNVQQFTKTPPVLATEPTYRHQIGTSIVTGTAHVASGSSHVTDLRPSSKKAGSPDIAARLV